MNSVADSAAAHTVVVVGSVNRDYVCNVVDLPRAGETVLGRDFFLSSGGKGGNQAVAAARLGAHVALVACVGDDADAGAVLEDLYAAGVDTSEVVTLGDVHTGAAFVIVGADGENFIVVAPGANSRLDRDRTRAAVDRRLRPGDVLVTQAEIPLTALAAAVTQADAIGCRVVVNLAPFSPLPADVLSRCDPLVVNEGEAAALLGLEPDAGADPRAMVAALGRRARSAVITLGRRGAVLVSGEVVEHLPAERVEVVDSTGAGDAFTGALAASLCGGADLPTSVRLGVAAGTWAVGRRGAQSSYPSSHDLSLEPGRDPSAAQS